MRRTLTVLAAGAVLMAPTAAANAGLASVDITTRHAVSQYQQYNGNIYRPSFSINLRVRCPAGALGQITVSPVTNAMTNPVEGFTCTGVAQKVVFNRVTGLKGRIPVTVRLAAGGLAATDRQVVQVSQG